MEKTNLLTEEVTAKAVASVERKDLNDVTQGFLNGFNTSYEVEEAAAAAAVAEAEAKKAAAAAAAKESRLELERKQQQEEQDHEKCDCHIMGPPAIGTCSVCGAWN